MFPYQQMFTEYQLCARQCRCQKSCGEQETQVLPLVIVQYSSLALDKSVRKLHIPFPTDPSFSYMAVKEEFQQTQGLLDFRVSSSGPKTHILLRGP